MRGANYHSERSRGGQIWSARMKCCRWSEWVNMCPFEIRYKIRYVFWLHIQTVFIQAIFQAVSAWLCSFQNNVVHFCNKTRYGNEFLMKELALRLNTKVHFPLCQYQLYKFVPSIQNWLTLESESTKIHFCKPSSASANLKLPCKPHIPSPEVLTIIPTARFFTKNEIMPGRLVQAVSERTIRCCYSSHSSADEIIDFLSSLQLESITPFVCPDKDTPLDSVKAFILITFKHQKPNTSNDTSTRLWKDKINFNKRGKRKFYLEKYSTKPPDYEYHSEPLRHKDALSNEEFSKERIQKLQKQPRRQIFQKKTPDYEYHSEPLRQPRRFVESGDFEEKDSERTQKMIQQLINIQKQFFTFRTVFFSYRL